jgi:pimeloyl-ACP methyl ester carboxylesterase
MQALVQTEFQEPLEASDEALIVHQHPDRNGHQLIVLVHGLGGARYGPKATWGRIPYFLFEDFPQLDVGLYEYRTLFRRWKFWRSVPVDAEARSFADLLRECDGYSDILLAGHSLGGLLCMAALQYFYSSHQRAELERIRGLFLMATPQTGSQRVPLPLSWFSKDFYALRPHGRFVSEVQGTLTDAFSLDETLTSPERILIPTWAVLGNSDFWVDRLSARLNLPASRCKHVHGSHTSIVKPAHKNSDAYEFLAKRIRDALKQSSVAQQPLPPFGTAGFIMPPSYVYALGRIEPRFPGISVEKELAQAMGRAEAANLTDRQALHRVLSQPENRYFVRQMRWVLTIEGLDTYILYPRDNADFDRLLDALRPAPRPTDVNVVIGMRDPIAPPEMCNGLMVPIVVYDQIYSFDIGSFIQSIPRPEGTTCETFTQAAEALFSSIQQMADNVGATDEHRALNYLAVRYPQIYAKPGEAHGGNSSLAAIQVHPSRLSNTRKIMDVIFSYTHRQTDVTEKFFVRVDVAEELPFVVTRLSPYYDR